MRSRVENRGRHPLFLHQTDARVLTKIRLFEEKKKKRPHPHPPPPPESTEALVVLTWPWSASLPEEVATEKRKTH